MMEEIIRYVMETPENTNPNILRDYFKSMRFDSSNIEEAIELIMGNLGSLNWNVLEEKLESLDESSGPKTYRYEDGTIGGIWADIPIKKIYNFIPRNQLVNCTMKEPRLGDLPVSIHDEHITDFSSFLSDYSGKALLTFLDGGLFFDLDAAYVLPDENILISEPGLYIVETVEFTIPSF